MNPCKVQPQVSIMEASPPIGKRLAPAVAFRAGPFAGVLAPIAAVNLQLMEGVGNHNGYCRTYCHITNYHWIGP